MCILVKLTIRAGSCYRQTHEPTWNELYTWTVALGVVPNRETHVSNREQRMVLVKFGVVRTRIMNIKYTNDYNVFAIRSFNNEKSPFAILWSEGDGVKSGWKNTKFYIFHRIFMRVLHIVLE